MKQNESSTKVDTAQTVLSNTLNNTKYKTKSSKKIKGVLATAFVLGVVVLGAQSASADQIATTPTSTTTRLNPMTDIVSAIATKFNLNTADVQAVVDGVMKTQRDAMDAKMQTMQANRLSAAVTAGTLTQAQADLITAKSAELRASMTTEQTANKTLTPEQRKAQMTANKTALEQWATTNGIPQTDLKFLAPMGGPGMGGFGGHKGFGHNKAPGQDATQTPAL
jgi:hypothetical protein